jgi:hypothetical protein
MQGRWRRWAWIPTAAILAAPGAAAGQAPPGFEVETQARLGGDADDDGITDGAVTPAGALNTALRVVLRGTGPACDRGVRRVWLIDGRRVSGPPAGPCELTATVPAEGTYRVRLETSGPAGEQTVEGDVLALDHLVVSLGDSVASGEGNPDRRADFGVPVRWQHQICHRSLRSGHARAALGVEGGERASAVTFVPLGCSGATIPRGLLGPYVGIEPDRDRTVQPPQVDLLNGLAARREVDAVLVSIGANDVHFGDIVQFCAAVQDCPGRRFDPRDTGREARDPSAPTLDRAITAALERLEERYAQLDATLPDRIAPERIVLVQYFDPTRGADGRYCAATLGVGRVEPAESEWAAKRVLGRLNAVIAEAGRRFGWTVVDGVAEAFDGHGICAGERQRWVRTPAESFFRHGGALAFASIAGTLHPNGRGHIATGELIRPRLRAVLGVTSADENVVDGTIDDDEDEILGMNARVAAVVGGVLLLLAIAGVAALLLARRRRRSTPA